VGGGVLERGERYEEWQEKSGSKGLSIDQYGGREYSEKYEYREGLRAAKPDMRNSDEEPKDQ